MSAKVYRSGSIKVYLPKDEPTIASSSLGSLVFTASTATFTDANNNDRRSDLDTTATYQVILSALWHDPVNKGYGMVQSSSGSGLLAPTTGEGIVVSVAPADWPANYAYASFIMVWLSKNGGPFFLHSIYPPDTSNTWAAMIITDVQPDAIQETSAFLMSTSTNSTYPSRTGFWGVSFESAGDTEDGVTLEDTADLLPYKPDQSSNYQLAITRGLKATFSVLNNNISDFVKSRAGEYTKFAVGANTYEMSLRAYQSASAVATGNRPVRMVFPIDSHKAVEVLYLAAALKEIQTGGSTNWGKQSPPKLNYTIEITNMDTTLQSVHVVSSRIMYPTSS